VRELDALPQKPVDVDADIYNKEFSDLDIKSVDASAKALTTMSNASVADWQSELHAVENDHRLLLWSKQEDADSTAGKIHCGVEDGRNGKTVTVLGR
jgi:hypothetical protein